jgi:cbb3-type cytochrome oxidase subunit 3
MLKTILTIVLSVTFFGVLFFLLVKKSIKKQIDYYSYIEKEKKSKKK